jgi:hypothetical protein
MSLGFGPVGLCEGLAPVSLRAVGIGRTWLGIWVAPKEIPPKWREEAGKNALGNLLALERFTRMGASDLRTRLLRGRHGDPAIWWVDGEMHVLDLFPCHRGRTR